VTKSEIEPTFTQKMQNFEISSKHDMSLSSYFLPKDHTPAKLESFPSNVLKSDNLETSGLRFSFGEDDKQKVERVQSSGAFEEEKLPNGLKNDRKAEIKKANSDIIGEVKQVKKRADLLELLKSASPKLDKVNDVSEFNLLESTPEAKSNPNLNRKYSPEQNQNPQKSPNFGLPQVQSSIPAIDQSDKSAIKFDKSFDQFMPSFNFEVSPVNLKS
jgi:hypothetical protein